MALYKNREVEIISYDEYPSQDKVSVYNKDLNEKQIVSVDELEMNDSEYKTFVVDRQQEKLDSLNKQREADKAEEQKRLQDQKKQEAQDKKNK